MSWASDKVYNSSPEECFAYDTGQPRDGAPGFPGEERWCWATLESGANVLQKRRLVRNAAGVNLLRGELCELASGSVESVDAKGPLSMPNALFAGIVPQGVNENRAAAIGLGAVGTVPTGYWFWAVVGGHVDVLPGAAAAIVVDSLLLPIAAGRVDDAAVAGLEHCIVGKSLEAAGAGVRFEMLCTVSL